MYEPWCMCWIQPTMDVVNQYPGLKNSDGGSITLKITLQCGNITSIHFLYEGE